MANTDKIKCLAQGLYKELAKQGYEVSDSGPVTVIHIWYRNDTGRLELENVSGDWRINCGAIVGKG